MLYFGWIIIKVVLNIVGKTKESSSKNHLLEVRVAILYFSSYDDKAHQHPLCPRWCIILQKVVWFKSLTFVASVDKSV